MGKPPKIKICDFGLAKLEELEAHSTNLVNKYYTCVLNETE
jgi:hypothetical protein